MVTEDNHMFKSWIKDVSETQKESYDAPTEVSGVPADQRLVGTDAHRKYVETMVKGSAYGKHFQINIGKNQNNKLMDKPVLLLQQEEGKS